MAKAKKGRENCNKAAAYVRVSTNEQADQGVSLDAQIQRLQAYCIANNLELVNVYREEGVSGSIPLAQRPEGKSLTAALESGEVSHVVALKLDRLFRDAANCLEATKEWDNAGVVLHLVEMGGQAMNTKSAMGRMFLTMAAAFAECERNLIGERTKTAMAHLKRTQPEKHLGRAPFGFAMVAGELVPVEREQEILKTIHALKGQGFRQQQIADRLNESGLAGQRGGRWNQAQVCKVLAASKGRAANQ